MELICQELLCELASPRTGPLISLYLPFPARGIPRLWLQWRNLVRKVEKELESRGIHGEEKEKLLGPARELIGKKDPRQPGTLGVAAFLAPQFFRAVGLPEAPAATCSVGEHFHLYPLVYLMRLHQGFHILALRANGARLIRVEGGMATLVEMPGLPVNMREALQFHDRDDYLGLHTTAAGAVAGHGAQFHGHGVGVDDEKSDTVLYFRMVNRVVRQTLGNEAGPLVLATVKANLPLYREVNTYPGLLEACVPGNPDRLKNGKLVQAAFALVEPLFRAENAQPVKRVLGGLGQGLVEEEPVHLQGQSRDGGVEILVLPEEEAGQTPCGADPHTEGCALINQLISQTMAHRGSVAFASGQQFAGHRLPCALLRHGRRAVHPVV